MAQRIRIKDIAEKTGVSIGTIDRVLHNRGHVAQDVRERVLGVMQEMGYEPNIMARTLANNKIVRIAALLPDPNRDPYWIQPKEGVEKAIESVKHYSVKVEFFFYKNDDPEHFQIQSEAAISTQPDALLVAPLFLQESLALLEHLTDSNMPIVLINTNIEQADVLSYIGQDSYQSGVLAGRLLNFGLNDGDHVMVLNLDKRVTNARHLMEKVRGFNDYFSHKQGKTIHIHTANFEDFDQKDLLKKWTKDQLTAFPDLKGFFVTNSRSYLLIECLEEADTQRLKIVGFDLIEPNLKLLAEDKVAFLINQNAWHQGYLGILSIVNQLILKKEVPHTQYLPLDVVVKENVAYYLKRVLEMPMLIV